MHEPPLPSGLSLEYVSPEEEARREAAKKAAAAAAAAEATAREEAAKAQAKASALRAAMTGAARDAATKAREQQTAAAIRQQAEEDRAALARGEQLRVRTSVVVDADDQSSGVLSEHAATTRVAGSAEHGAAVREATPLRRSMSDMRPRTAADAATRRRLDAPVGAAGVALRRRTKSVGAAPHVPSLRLGSIGGGPAVSRAPAGQDGASQVWRAAPSTASRSLTARTGFGTPGAPSSRRERRSMPGTRRSLASVLTYSRPLRRSTFRSALSPRPVGAVDGSGLSDGQLKDAWVAPDEGLVPGGPADSSAADSKSQQAEQEGAAPVEASVDADVAVGEAKGDDDDDGDAAASGDDGEAEADAASDGEGEGEAKAGSDAEQEGLTPEEEAEAIAQQEAWAARQEAKREREKQVDMWVGAAQFSLLAGDSSLVVAAAEKAVDAARDPTIFDASAMGVLRQADSEKVQRAMIQRAMMLLGIYLIKYVATPSSNNHHDHSLGTVSSLPTGTLHKCGDDYAGATLPPRSSALLVAISHARAWPMKRS